MTIAASASSVFLKMDKLEYRAVIKFLTKEGKSPTEINARLHAVYGTNAPSFSTVKVWARNFKYGRETLDEDPRSGRPTDATGDDVVKRVEDLITKNDQMTKKQLAGMLKISSGSVLRILHDKLGLKWVRGHWVADVENRSQGET